MASLKTQKKWGFSDSFVGLGASQKPIRANLRARSLFSSRWHPADVHFSVALASYLYRLMIVAELASMYLKTDRELTHQASRRIPAVE